jgi:hypothetical protein
MHQVAAFFVSAEDIRQPTSRKSGNPIEMQSPAFGRAIASMNMRMSEC